MITSSNRLPSAAQSKSWIGVCAAVAAVPAFAAVATEIVTVLIA